TPHREQLPAQLPTPVLWQDYVPLRALLPHVAALAHHGGIGTTAEALRAGTPQLVVPLAHDQFDNAARVRALGVGASLHARRLSSARMARQLGKVVDNPAMAAACARLAAMAMPADLEPLCEELVSLAG